MNIVNVGYRSTNYYVLAESAPRLLVDAGWPGTLGALQHACRRMGITLDAIPYQLVTHYHPDHAGLVQELQTLGVQLLVLDTQLAGIPLLRTYVKPRDHYQDVVLGDHTLLSAGTSRAFLAQIGIPGAILSTPGHSADSVTLLLDDGSAFTGDLTPPAAVPADPADAAYQSWERLRAAGARTIYPGHGPAWSLGSAP
ncbi:MAG TPA: MBL fold metallo-hydrolase [Chloroflexia bacterium]|nr:MBL fold metallo-hydrolase [Chloroflexia bacterium]